MTMLVLQLVVQFRLIYNALVAQRVTEIKSFLAGKRWIELTNPRSKKIQGPIFNIVHGRDPRGVFCN